jgi:hypothetical protein
MIQLALAIVIRGIDAVVDDPELVDFRVDEAQVTTLMPLIIPWAFPLYYLLTSSILNDVFLSNTVSSKADSHWDC